MVYQIELETTIPITEFINVEGQLFFSKDAFHSIRKIKPDILFRVVRTSDIATSEM